jgi:hypothetical protein
MPASLGSRDEASPNRTTRPHASGMDAAAGLGDSTPSYLEKTAMIISSERLCGYPNLGRQSSRSGFPPRAVVFPGPDDGLAHWDHP